MTLTFNPLRISVRIHTDAQSKMKDHAVKSLQCKPTDGHYRLHYLLGNALDVNVAIDSLVVHVYALLLTTLNRLFFFVLRLSCKFYDNLHMFFQQKFKHESKHNMRLR